MSSPLSSILFASILISWPLALVVIAIVGSIASVAFVFFMLIRHSNKDSDELADMTELSERNIPAPKFDPPYYGPRLVKK